MLKTERIYTDYKFEGKIPNDNALAKALQWLYDESEFNDDQSELYYMNTRLPLYDFMTLVVLFITSAHGEYGATKLHQIIQTLEEGKSQFDWQEKCPTYKYEGKYILINKMESWTTEVILWAAYIYCLFRTEEYHDDPSANCHRAKEVIYEVFKKKTRLNDKDFQKHFLMQHRDATMRVFIQSWYEELKKKEKSKTENQEGGGLEERIKQLEVQLAEKNKQLLDLQSKLKAYETAQARSLEEYEETAEPPLEVLYNRVKFELFLRFLELGGVDILNTNKTEIGNLWHAFTEKSADDCRKYCSTRSYVNNYTKEKIKELNRRLALIGLEKIQL